MVRIIEKRIVASLKIEKDAFEPIKYHAVHIEQQIEIFKLLIILKSKRDKHNKIIKHKARMVMDG